MIAGSASCNCFLSPTVTLNRQIEGAPVPLRVPARGRHGAAVWTWKSPPPVLRGELRAGARLLQIARSASSTVVSCSPPSCPIQASTITPSASTRNSAGVAPIGSAPASTATHAVRPDAAGVQVRVDGGILPGRRHDDPHRRVAACGQQAPVEGEGRGAEAALGVQAQHERPAGGRPVDVHEVCEDDARDVGERAHGSPDGSPQAHPDQCERRHAHHRDQRVDRDGESVAGHGQDQST